MPMRNGGRESEKASRGALGAYQGAPGALIAVNRVERDRRQRGASATEGKAATLRGGLAHDVSVLLGVGRHLGSQPHANTSITIMRVPDSHRAVRSTTARRAHRLRLSKAGI
jgi:hypothetical protein